MRYDTASRLSGWESDLRQQMAAITSGVPGGGSSLNNAVVSRLHSVYVSLLGRGYLLPRYDTAAGDAAARRMLLQLSAETGYNTPLVRAFLVNLYNGAKSGAIPEVKYDPVGYAQRRAQVQRLDPSAKGIGQRLTETASAAASVGGKIGLGLVLLAGLGAAVYFRLGRK